ncbi:tetratricopeptide repeat protein [Pseudooceanicola onchidii]|uniref:tetratricopeptide repeat protein n=1 Tax=Pseudooceanicola onchidii TaxID=2562279 RepID=UPI001F118B4D|nr:tetratricopeptide repeat protein [Pseudooceanicola onchidii]
MIRAACAALACLIVVGACTDTARIDKDTPYAPGVDRKKEAVDGMIVGNRLLEAKQYELALDAFTRAAATEGLTPKVYAGLGAANLGLGRLGQAEVQLREAIKAPDAAPQTWNNLGVVLMDQGEVPEAVEVLRRAFALSNGENDEIRDNLRLALAMNDKTVYDPDAEQELDLVRSGSGQYRLREQFP